jgi:hypothetical protein
MFYEGGGRREGRKKEGGRKGRKEGRKEGRKKAPKEGRRRVGGRKKEWKEGRERVAESLRIEGRKPERGNLEGRKREEGRKNGRMEGRENEGEMGYPRRRTSEVRQGHPFLEPRGRRGLFEVMAARFSRGRRGHRWW